MATETLPAYAELHCLSNFTFLRGASHPEELIRQAQTLCYTALAITDECSLAGIVRAHIAARDCELALIVGSEFRLTDGLQLVVLATDRQGYAGLAQLITTGRRAAGKGSYQLSREAFAHGMGRCLALLVPDTAPDTGCGIRDTRGWRNPAWEEALREQAEWVARTFPGQAWILAELHFSGHDREYLQILRDIGASCDLALAAAGDVHMHIPERRPLQDTLAAIRIGKTVATAGFALFPNGERHLRPRQALASIYPPDLLEQTQNIAARCHFSLAELHYEYPQELIPAGQTPAACLRRLTAEGAQQRWPAGVTKKIRAQIEHELQLIKELRYEPYFLTVHDIVRFAKSRGILCQGRGSAANSAVCYCLGITEVDPARIEMLFERFISKERDEPPDIDIDFEHQRREEVMQYIYNKYGRERAALTATVITYRPKSAVRDVGKAMGLDTDQVGRLAKNLSWWDGQQIDAQRLRETGFDPDNPVLQRVMWLVSQILRFPRHLSQHVGGFVISRGPLSQLVPIENAAMPDRTIIQWDKNDLDALGLLKIDCLALGILSAIHRALDYVSAIRGIPFGMSSVPAEDPETYAMIQRADTMGVFQIESRAQMAMLPRLRPACFYDLVIEVAIVRPGPIQGDMVHPYLRRRQGLEAVTYPSEAVREVLSRTLGVPIFQEQVIKLAIVAAGFSPGEADMLRRSMATWHHNGMLASFEQRLIDGMRERGYDASFARRIFQQILGFGEYGFPESHAASFALLVYVSAWLKCHEPAAFTCALLNSQPMGFYSAWQLVQDARRRHVEIRPADVCYSEWDCGLETSNPASRPPHPLTGAGDARRDTQSIPPMQPAIRLGLCMVKGLSRKAGARLVAARRDQPFTDVGDLACRARLGSRDMQTLANADALAGLAGNRHRAHWAISGIEKPLPLMQHMPPVDNIGAMPWLRPPTEAEDIREDLHSLGLTLRRHPLALLRGRLTAMNLCPAQQLQACTHGERVRTVGLVTNRQRPASANNVTFLTLEDETGQINVIVWQHIAVRQRRTLLHARLLGVEGEIQREGEVLHLIAHRLHDHTALIRSLPTRSRDFH